MSGKEYTIIGDVVNLASRLEQLNEQLGTRLLVSQYEGSCDDRQPPAPGRPGETLARVESIRAREVRRLLNKLSLSPEQEEAIENLSRSLGEELVRGPIAKTIALVQEPRGSVATAKTSHGRKRIVT